VVHIGLFWQPRDSDWRDWIESSLPFPGSIVVVRGGLCDYAEREYGSNDNHCRGNHARHHIDNGCYDNACRHGNDGRYNNNGRHDNTGCHGNVCVSVNLRQSG